MFKLKVTGTKEAMTRSHVLERELKKAVGAALYAEGCAIMQDSKANYAPVVKGFLKESGYVTPPESIGPLVRVMLAYPGIEAVRLHENPRTGKTGGIGPRGQKYPEGTYSKVGEWKFLETPAMKAMPGMRSRFVAHVGETLKRLRGFM